MRARWLVVGLGGWLALGTALAREPVAGLEDADPRRRRTAVGKLAEIPGRWSLERLLTALADEDAGVRDRAVDVLVRREEPRDEERLLSLARRAGRSEVRQGLARVLGRRALEGAAPVLAALLRDRDEGVREAAARGLARVGDATHVAALEALLADRRSEPAIAAVEALDVLDPAGSAERGLRAAASRHATVRVAAVRILARRRGEPLDRALVEALEDPVWSVRVAAARAVGRIRLVPAVPALIAALEREEGRVREEVHEALTAVTGCGLPADVARWRAWWAREGPGFVPPPRPARPPEDARASAVTYHSIPVTSRAVTFVIDASRSMLRSTEGEDGPVSRRDLALGELERTLRRLPRGARFRLVLFGAKVESWPPRCCPATPAAVAAAMKHARRFPPGGWTDVYAALRLALEDPSADTVFLLTDGAPSAGRFTGRQALLDGVERLNRYRLVRIHTVGIDTDRIGKRWRGFLRELARRNDGAHTAR
jgi:hypothetical protein